MYFFVKGEHLETLSEVIQGDEKISSEKQDHEKISGVGKCEEVLSNDVLDSAVLESAERHNGDDLCDGIVIQEEDLAEWIEEEDQVETSKSSLVNCELAPHTCVAQNCLL